MDSFDGFDEFDIISFDSAASMTLSVALSLASSFLLFIILMTNNCSHISETSVVSKYDIYKYQHYTNVIADFDARLSTESKLNMSLDEIIETTTERQREVHKLRKLYEKLGRARLESLNLAEPELEESGEK
jgi:hypothetical protein